MNPSRCFRVLDAIGNGFEGRVYSIGAREHSEDVYGITWPSLLRATGLPQEDLKALVVTLLEHGLVREGGPVGHPILRLLARPPCYLWITTEGRQILADAAREPG